MRYCKLSALIVTTLLGGCVTTMPETVDSQMGQAVEMAKAQQTLNPETSQDTQPVKGVDGKSAEALMDRYHKGFQAPPPTNIFSIGVGGGTSSTVVPGSTSH